MDELGGGLMELPGQDRSLVVVEVEDRQSNDQVHAGVVVGVKRSHIAPVGALTF
jgi:hypothetical protein